MKLRNSLQATALGLGAGGGLLALALAAAPVLAPAAIGQVSADHPGAGVYQKACAACHDNPGTTRAATLASMRTLAPARLREVMAPGGIMAPMAAALNDKEKTDLVTWLTAGQAATAATWSDALLCAPDKRAVSASASIISNGFGIDSDLSRSLSASEAGIS